MANGWWPLRPKALVGMVHAGALPGAPFNETTVEMLAVQAAGEARLLAETGFDAIIVENMHDRPYLHGRHGPEVAAAMTRIALEVADATDLPLGVQVLSGGEREALAVALAAGARFIRCENFVYAHVADEGLLPDAAAGPLLRYRRSIGAEAIAIMCDVKKKHASHAITADVSLAEACHAAEFFGADGLVVTGRFTGEAVAPDDLAEARGATRLPVWVGSGATPESLAALYQHADAVIVGSWIKQAGVWSNPPDADRCRAMVEAARRARAE
ncbi:MAG: BtpA family membrane complex biogenesis protein [Leptolyngbya sp. PLA2]|nr:BtpA family membrane complex biogenesis protein [Leptolyngbya sp.]MCE7972277.1 BtpA family membrane complex biogenesis protein [Leptolyngbya sp. PL-A2]MCQ3941143.1 BtpA family membrane complex biogenesis protein [cyanobacterium CYA1]MCZ7633209.1 BtpA/SgcQ family protein [Phycisphaerales bacterium]MDL1905427.1 BtpA/SgcQ family protein [Synechococcales cyanobacterium CNB]GIK18313.1 MAG: hypothetical protein BroJett004_04770 [Planctomycetota bacterium]